MKINCNYITTFFIIMKFFAIIILFLQQIKLIMDNILKIINVFKNENFYVIRVLYLEKIHKIYFYKLLILVGKVKLNTFFPVKFSFLRINIFCFF